MTLVVHQSRTATIKCLHQGRRLIWTDNNGELLSPGRRSGVEMIVYATKYALTSGIERMDTHKRDPFSDGLFIHSDGPYYTAKHLFKDESAARVDAEEMRRKKISSLEKQIEKLKAINFKVVDR